MANPYEGREFEQLEVRLRTMLPAQYQDCYDEVQPVSMGSAGLKYGLDGKVAWNEIWGSFCDLAMAGGPPHRGTLLAPGSKEEIDIHADLYQEVVAEICRGVSLVTGLCAEPSPFSGWVRMYCTSAAMAGWLARAIVMENVSASFKGLVLYLPAGPGYRVEKETKNVVTAVAKTCHYWSEHTSHDRQQAIARLFRQMESELPLLQPEFAGHDLSAGAHWTLSRKVAESIHQGTGLRASQHGCAGWLGLDCQRVDAAVWMMRMLVVSNLLSRREGTVVLVPLNPAADPNGKTAVRIVLRTYGFAKAEGIL
jgi:sirohydrochlorin cobaltochelatase